MPVAELLLRWCNHHLSQYQAAMAKAVDEGKQPKHKRMGILLQVRPGSKKKVWLCVCVCVCVCVCLCVSVSVCVIRFGVAKEIRFGVAKAGWNKKMLRRLKIGHKPNFVRTQQPMGVRDGVGVMA